MLRTRDFVLLFVTIVFLLTAIGATVISKNNNPKIEVRALDFVETSDEVRVAKEIAPEELNRAKMLADMRKKISESSNVTITNPLEEIDNNKEPNEPEEDSLALEIQNCSNYSLYSGQWPNVGVKSEIAEGARIFYTENNFVDKSVSSSTSTDELVDNSVREVVLQLPVSPAINGQNNCLTLDVVGVALDGSLIRNNETGLYGLFGADTLVGYALDGFPIYGTSNIATDVCGGATINNQYSYFVSSDRSNILNCFSALPQSI